MSDGWIKLHRALLSWEWYTTPNMVHFWIHCLLLANHEDGFWRGIQVKKGQFISGRKSLSANTGLSEQQIRTCIDRLKSTNELTSQSTNEYTIFTIISWEKYQIAESSNQQDNQRATNEQPTSNQPSTTNKNDKNEKNDKNDKNNTENTAHFAPPAIEEVKSFFLLNGSNHPEAIKFYAYYDSNGWRVGRNKMKKWKSAAIGWITRSKTEYGVAVPTEAQTAIAGSKERQPVPNGRIEYKSSHSCKYCVAVSLRLGLNVDGATEWDRLIAMNPVTEGEMDCIRTTFAKDKDMLKRWNEYERSPYRGRLI